MMRRTSVLPEGVTLVGEIEGDADLVVRGRVEGPIHVSGALVVESTGIVRGHVRARSVTVRGVLKGDAFGDEVVRVEASARLVGELTAPRVTVVPGAQFRGQVHVGEVGDPRLSTYDPTLHTFSGWPAPAVAPEPPLDLAARVLAADEAQTGDWTSAKTGEAQTGDWTPVPAGEAQTGDWTPVPAGEAKTGEAQTGDWTPAPAGEAQTGEAQTGDWTSAPTAEATSPHADEHDALPPDVDETLSEARPPTLPPERVPLRMPRIGRTRARRRGWT